MKTMKVLLSAAAVLMTVSVMAQSPKKEKMDATQRATFVTEQMTKELSLSKSQASKIQQIFLENFQQRDKQRADMKNVPDSLRGKGPKGDRPMGDRPEMGDHHGDRPMGEAPDSVKGKGPRGGAQFEKLDAQIKTVLTDAQYKKWTEQRAKMHAQRPQHPQGQLAPENGEADK